MALLSPGRWHERVPKEMRANLRMRDQFLAAAERDVGVQRELMRMCRDDLLFWTNLFCFQYNPKHKGAARIAPFITYSFQDRLFLDRPETTGKRGVLWCYEHNRTAVVQKSRDMGISWSFLLLEDWLCLFHDHTQALNISRDADSVDCKSPDSLFWKLRYIHKYLPGWMTGSLVEQKMHFEYPKSSSFITGEASTGSAGVGGRASVIFVDEFPLIKDAVEVRQRTANTADVRFFNGTHQGVGTEFARMCDRSLSPEIVLLTVHWSEHPLKNPGLYQYDPEHPGVPIILDKTYQYPPGFQFVLDGSPAGGPHPGIRSPWYDKKCVDIGDARAIAMELDIDPQGSTKQFYSSVVIRELIQEHARPPVWEGEIKYDAVSGMFRSLERAPTGRLKLWALPRADGTLPPSQYKIGADISQGTGATPSCLSGIDASKGMKILEYANPFLVPDDFALVAIACCWFLQDANGLPAKLCWESAGPTGKTFERRIGKLHFNNVYYPPAEAYAKGGSAKRPGWYPSTATKLALHSDYRTALEKRWLLNPSKPALAECLNFAYNVVGDLIHSGAEDHPDPSGARGNHGDQATADAIAWMLSKDLGVVPTTGPKKEVFPHGSLGWRREFWAQREREEQNA